MTLINPDFTIPPAEIADGDRLGDSLTPQRIEEGLAVSRCSIYSRQVPQAINLSEVFRICSASLHKGATQKRLLS